MLPSPSPVFGENIQEHESIQMKKLLLGRIKLDKRKAADVSTDDTDKAKRSNKLSVHCHRLAISLEEVILSDHILYRRLGFICRGGLSVAVNFDWMIL